MKMWCTVFMTFLLIISAWFFSYDILLNKFFRKTAIEVKIVENENSDLNFLNETVQQGFIPGKIKHHVPKFMLDLYEKLKRVRKNDLNHQTPDIVKSVVPIHTDSVNPFLLREDFIDDNHILVFNVPNSNIDETFVKAELRVLTLLEIKSRQSLGIKRDIKISLLNETTKKLTKLDEKSINHIDNAWLTFNVSKAVRRLLNKQFKNMVLKLVITIKSYLPYSPTKLGLLKLSLMPLVENIEHDYPILLLYYQSVKSERAVREMKERNSSEKAVRKRRNVEDDYEEETNKLWDDEGMNKATARKLRRMRNTCRKRPLYIDFAEIQYDTWIVQPTGYEAFQCSGKCFYPVAEHLSPTKHAIVQALLHSVAPSRAPRSCCVPTKLDSISVLYVDGNGVLTYRYSYKEMVVAECGCR